MEVGLGPNEGCSAKGKKIYKKFLDLYEILDNQITVIHVDSNYLPRIRV
jgi:hypothetical protein